MYCKSTLSSLIKKTIDAIPLKNNSKTKDSFLKEINTNASIKEYAKSVLNPVSITLKQLMSEANKTREELGGLLFLLDSFMQGTNHAHNLVSRLTIVSLSDFMLTKCSLFCQTHKNNFFS